MHEETDNYLTALARAYELWSRSTGINSRIICYKVLQLPLAFTAPKEICSGSLTEQFWDLNWNHFDENCEGDLVAFLQVITSATTQKEANEC